MSYISGKYQNPNPTTIRLKITFSNVLKSESDVSNVYIVKFKVSKVKQINNSNFQSWNFQSKALILILIELIKSDELH